jgi:DNA replication and repair protein RecF
MYLTHLALTNFRNFARLDIDVPNGTLLLVGDNAQGKTSLLEAIYLLSTATSFQARSDRQLINFLAAQDPLAVCRIVADFVCGDRKHHLEFRIIQEKNELNGATRVRKEALFDGTTTKLNQVVGHFNAVLFLPQMLGIIEGSPSDRRRYLDLTLSQSIRDYAPHLTAYQKSISQRNALLKQLNERGGDHDQLLYWENQISADGAFLIAARVQAIRELEDLAALIHMELTRGTERLRLNYLPGYDPLPQQTDQLTMDLEIPIERRHVSVDTIREGFQAALVENRPKEILRGQTTLGPHRDDIRFMANNIDLGLYGSRGQIRTVMLSLKIAEISWIKQRTGHWPVLLLDEVLAELDPQRRLDLLVKLSQSEQALLTTTDLDLFATEFIQDAGLWRISGGKVSAALPVDFDGVGGS